MLLGFGDFESGVKGIEQAYQLFAFDGSPSTLIMPEMMASRNVVLRNVIKSSVARVKMKLAARAPPSRRRRPPA